MDGTSSSLKSKTKLERNKPITPKLKKEKKYKLKVSVSMFEEMYEIPKSNRIIKIITMFFNVK